MRNVSAFRVTAIVTSPRRRLRAPRGQLEERQAMLFPEAIPFPFACFYDLVVTGKVLAAEYHRIASTVDLASGLLLDIGAGTGGLAIEIARSNRVLRVLGIDMSVSMVRLARRKACHLPNASFRVMNARRLLLADSEVDLVVSTASMHHWRQPSLVFHEIYRVLKTGGRAFIYDIRSDATPQEIFAELPRKLFFPPRFAIPLVFRLHGFTQESLQSKILPIISSSSFREWRLETVGIWYRISLFKR